MRDFILAISLVSILSPSVASHEVKNEQSPKDRNPPLEVVVDRFDVSDSILRVGLSELSLKGIEGLHLGFEEILRDKIQDDPRKANSHFSLHLEKKKVRQIIEALCDSDGRYTWSEAGASVNVYPRAIKDDPSYLFNLRIGHIELTAVPDPDQALTPLSKLFPDQQIGYFGPGLGNNAYSEPWNATFDNITVRQFIDQIAEHMGSRTSWVWEGGRQERMFTFLTGGFNTLIPEQ